MRRLAAICRRLLGVDADSRRRAFTVRRNQEALRAFTSRYSTRRA